SAIAWRSEPTPVSAVVATRNVAARAAGAQTVAITAIAMRSSRRGGTADGVQGRGHGAAHAGRGRSLGHGVAPATPVPAPVGMGRGVCRDVTGDGTRPERADTGSPCPQGPGDRHASCDRPQPEPTMRATLMRLLHDTEGQDLAEYGIALAIIAAG